MRTTTNWTPDRAEAYFNQSLIGEVSTWLAEAVGDLAGHAHGAKDEPSAEAPAEASAPEASQHTGFFSRLDARLWRQEQKRREAWLAESADMAELERRIRELDRN